MAKVIAAVSVCLRYAPWHSGYLPQKTEEYHLEIPNH